MSATCPGWGGRHALTPSISRQRNSTGTSSASLRGDRFGAHARAVAAQHQHASSGTSAPFQLTSTAPRPNYCYPLWFLVLQRRVSRPVSSPLGRKRTPAAAELQREPQQQLARTRQPSGTPPRRLRVAGRQAGAGSAAGRSLLTSRARELSGPRKPSWALHRMSARLQPSSTKPGATRIRSVHSDDVPTVQLQLQPRPDPRELGAHRLGARPRRLHGRFAGALRGAFRAKRARRLHTPLAASWRGERGSRAAAVCPGRAESLRRTTQNRG